MSALWHCRARGRIYLLQCFARVCLPEHWQHHCPWEDCRPGGLRALAPQLHLPEPGRKQHQLEQPPVGSDASPRFRSYWGCIEKCRAQLACTSPEVRNGTPWIPCKAPRLVNSDAFHVTVAKRQMAQSQIIQSVGACPVTACQALGTSVSKVVQKGIQHFREEEGTHGRGGGMRLGKGRGRKEVGNRAACSVAPTSLTVCRSKLFVLSWFYSCVCLCVCGWMCVFGTVSQEISVVPWFTKQRKPEGSTKRHSVRKGA